MKRIILLATVIVCLMSACEDGTQIEIDEVEAIAVEEAIVPAHVIAKLRALGFGTSDLKRLRTKDENGEREETYLIEGDISMSLAQINSLHQDLKDGSVEDVELHYRTTTYYQSSQDIWIYAKNLPFVQRAGLQMAVNEWNAQNLEFRFYVSTSSSSPYKIQVYQAWTGINYAIAEWPTGSSSPGYRIRTNNNLPAPLNAGEWKTIFMHELGHTLGLRHSDYDGSCGGSPEADPGVGAVHIPSTPTGCDPNSIFNKNLDINVINSFSAADEDALNYLWSGLPNH